MFTPIDMGFFILAFGVVMAVVICLQLLSEKPSMKTGNTATIITTIVIILVLFYVLRKIKFKYIGTIFIILSAVIVVAVVYKNSYTDSARAKYAVVKGIAVALIIDTVLVCFIEGYGDILEE